jgi:hypothetical protein
MNTGMSCFLKVVCLFLFAVGFAWLAIGASSPDDSHGIVGGWCAEESCGSSTVQPCSGSSCPATVKTCGCNTGLATGTCSGVGADGGCTVVGCTKTNYCSCSSNDSCPP